MREKVKVFFCKKINGSNTIEASLIMPIILTILFMLIYLSLFLYVRAGSVRVGYIAVLRGSQLETESKKNKGSLCKEGICQVKRRKLFRQRFMPGKVCNRRRKYKDFY